MRRLHSAAPLFTLALLAAVAVLPATAHAGGRYRPMYAGFGAGPDWSLDCCSARAHISGEVGWHFDGEDRGFFLQVEANTVFATDDVFQFYGGLRLGGDIEVTGNHHAGFMLRPNALLGFGVQDAPGPNNTFGFAVIEPTCDLRFAVADRLLAFWLRPVAFTFLFYFDRAFAVAYAPMLGLDFQF